MNIPNILTSIRVILIPIFAYYLFDKHYDIAIIIFLVAGLTDILDGYIARKYNLITDFGKVADPLADKLMQVTAIIILTIQEFIPTYVVVVIFVKELMMGIGTMFLYKDSKLVVGSNFFGKLATVLFYIAILFTIIARFGTFRLAYEDRYIGIMFVIAVASSLYAMWTYVVGYIKIKSNVNNK